jgi:large subunit ribosomal protein L13
MLFFAPLVLFSLPPLLILQSADRLPNSLQSWSIGFEARKPAFFITARVMAATKTYNANKTYVAKPGEVEKKWHVVDGTDKVVGRLASDIAMVLMGKHRPEYTPHIDTGDFVIVVNAEKVKFTGRKWEQKEYTWFTGYTRQRKETAAERLASHPERILHDAVRRMLPKNKLATKMLAKLKIYKGPQHPHQAQMPAASDFGAV